MDPELNRFENLAILDSIGTEKSAPMVEHVARKILFIGGIMSLIVIDLPSKQLIARFRFQGNIKSIFLSKSDLGGIHILSKIYEEENGTYENRFHKITFNSVVYRQIKNSEISDVTAMTLDHSVRDSIYVAINGGKTLCRYNLDTNCEDGLQP